MAANVMAWTLEGRSTREIAERLEALGVSVTHRAVVGFQRRHREEIVTLEDAVRTQLTGRAITEKAERIRRLSALYDGMQAIVDERGLMAEDVKWIGDTESGREVKVQRFDAGLVREMRAVLREVAEQLGQIPRPPINVSNTQEVRVIIERRNDWRSSD